MSCQRGQGCWKCTSITSAIKLKFSSVQFSTRALASRRRSTNSNSKGAAEGLQQKALYGLICMMMTRSRSKKTEPAAVR